MTATWRIAFRKGSFRGVKFQVESHEAEGGRRIADHEFPYKNEGWTEDFGRKVRSFKLTLYVVGDDYFPDRDALIKALEKKGPAVLVHPYLGRKKVEARDYTLSESTKDGGIATFSVLFKETGKLPAPEGAADFFEQAKDAASDVQLALQRSFATFNAPNPASIVFESAAALVNKGSDILYTAANGVRPSQFNSIADLTYSIRNLKANNRALIASPSKLSSAFVSTLGDLRGALNVRGLFPEDAKGKPIILQSASDKAAQGKAIRDVFGPILRFGDTLPLTYQTTPQRQLEAKNQQLFRQLLVGAAIAEAVVVSAGTDYATLDEALEQRDYLADQIDRQLEDPTLSDEAYDSLQALKSLAVRGIPPATSELPKLAFLELTDLTPSLVVCYDLYETLIPESDILARNKITHPGFISPLKPLEVVAGV